MITLTNVFKSFNGQTVLGGLDLFVPPGRITVIIGRSGGGKSVLLKTMIGLIRPDSGAVTVDGRNITHMREKELNDVRKDFGMLFQEAALFDSMTVGDNVAFPLREHTRLTEQEIGARVDEKLEQVGLPGVKHKMPSELSGGMRKRVGLARALALDPGIILFDEPTTGLDPVMRETIDDLIVETQRRTGATCVVISHDIESVFYIAHQVAMLEDGKIVAQGTPDEIRSSAVPSVQRFIRVRSGQGADAPGTGAAGIHNA